MTKPTSQITFTATALNIMGHTIVKLPEDVSNQLPSRGQVTILGTVNDIEVKIVLEPDGNWGHWFKTSPVSKVIGTGDKVQVHLTPTKDWPEPEIPTDFADALQTATAEVQSLWSAITPMARWEWVRWINETTIVETRQRRIEVSISKMQHGKRRPCCFNLSACTDPTVSKNGRLMGLNV